MLSNLSKNNINHINLYLDNNDNTIFFTDNSQLNFIIEKKLMNELFVKNKDKIKINYNKKDVNKKNYNIKTVDEFNKMYSYSLKNNSSLGKNKNANANANANDIKIGPPGPPGPAFQPDLITSRDLFDISQERLKDLGEGYSYFYIPKNQLYFLSINKSNEYYWSEGQKIVGVRGEKGLQGEKGDIGPQGEKGEAGPQGPALKIDFVWNDPIHTINSKLKRQIGINKFIFCSYDGKIYFTLIENNEINFSKGYDFVGLKGEKGEKGEKGMKGEPGLPGASANVFNVNEYISFDPYTLTQKQLKSREEGWCMMSIVNGNVYFVYKENNKYKVSNELYLAGPPGLQGNKGEDGPQGEKGPVGERGPMGLPGPSGPIGKKGEKGNPGPAFNPNLTSPKLPDQFTQNQLEKMGEGFAYLCSNNGLIYFVEKNDGFYSFSKGFPIVGKKGDQGEKGERGEMGFKGEKGEPGQKGEMGEKGPVGQKGEKGEKGEIGPRGYQGIQGPAFQPQFIIDKPIEDLTQIELENYGQGTSILSSINGKLYFIQYIDDIYKISDGYDIVGKEGTKGEKGEKGDSGSRGPIGPPGKVGDSYFNYNINKNLSYLKGGIGIGTEIIEDEILRINNQNKSTKIIFENEENIENHYILKSGSVYQRICEIENQQENEEKQNGNNKNTKIVYQIESSNPDNFTYNIGNNIKMNNDCLTSNNIDVNENLLVKKILKIKEHEICENNETGNLEINANTNSFLVNTGENGTFELNEKNISVNKSHFEIEYENDILLKKKQFTFLNFNDSCLKLSTPDQFYLYSQNKNGKINSNVSNLNFENPISINLQSNDCSSSIQSNIGINFNYDLLTISHDNIKLGSSNSKILFNDNLIIDQSGVDESKISSNNIIFNVNKSKFNGDVFILGKIDLSMAKVKINGSEFNNQTNEFNLSHNLSVVNQKTDISSDSFTLITPNINIRNNFFDLADLSLTLNNCSLNIKNSVNTDGNQSKIFMKSNSNEINIDYFVTKINNGETIFTNNKLIHNNTDKITNFEKTLENNFEKKYERGSENYSHCNVDFKDSNIDIDSNSSFSFDNLFKIFNNKIEIKETNFLIDKTNLYINYSPSVSLKIVDDLINVEKYNLKLKNNNIEQDNVNSLLINSKVNIENSKIKLEDSIFNVNNSLIIENDKLYLKNLLIETENSNIIFGKLNLNISDEKVESKNQTWNFTNPNITIKNNDALFKINNENIEISNFHTYFKGNVSINSNFQIEDGIFNINNLNTNIYDSTFSYNDKIIIKTGDEEDNLIMNNAKVKINNSDYVSENSKISFVETQLKLKNNEIKLEDIQLFAYSNEKQFLKIDKEDIQLNLANITFENGSFNFNNRFYLFNDKLEMNNLNVKIDNSTFELFNGKTIINSNFFKLNNYRFVSDKSIFLWTYNESKFLLDSGNFYMTDMDVKLKKNRISMISNTGNTLLDINDENFEMKKIKFFGDDIYNEVKNSDALYIRNNITFDNSRIFFDKIYFTDKDNRFSLIDTQWKFSELNFFYENCIQKINSSHFDLNNSRINSKNSEIQLIEPKISIISNVENEKEKILITEKILKLNNITFEQNDFSLILKDSENKQIWNFQPNQTNITSTNLALSNTVFSVERDGLIKLLIDDDFKVNKTDIVVNDGSVVYKCNRNNGFFLIKHENILSDFIDYYFDHSQININKKIKINSQEIKINEIDLTIKKSKLSYSDGKNNLIYLDNEQLQLNDLPIQLGFSGSNRIKLNNRGLEIDDADFKLNGSFISGAMQIERNKVTEVNNTHYYNKTSSKYNDSISNYNNCEMVFTYDNDKAFAIKKHNDLPFIHFGYQKNSGKIGANKNMELLFTDFENIVFNNNQRNIELLPSNKENMILKYKNSEKYLEISDIDNEFLISSNKNIAFNNCKIDKLLILLDNDTNKNFERLVENSIEYDKDSMIEKDINKNTYVDQEALNKILIKKILELEEKLIKFEKNKNY